jgi:TonB family protein
MAKPHRVERRLVAILDANERRTGTSHTVATIASILMSLQLPLAAITTEPPAPPAFEQLSPASVPRPTPAPSPTTVRDNTHWDGSVLEIRTTETSNNQPRVVTARYRQSDVVAAGPTSLRRRPLPIPAGQFGAGAYLAEDVSTLIPPVPIRRVHPQFTPEALRAKIQGVVEIEAIVDIDGRVSDARVTRSLDTEYGLDAQALAAVMASRYAPARLGGQPVRSRIVVESRFTVR